MSPSRIALLSLAGVVFVSVASLPARAQRPEEQLTLCPPVPVESQDLPAAVRVGVFYKNTQTGVRHANGIAAAVEQHPLRGALCFKLFPYISDEDGAEALVAALVEDSVDVVVGPTDSGAFVTALEEPAIEAARVPVISGLVVADAGNDPDGWFFRANVDVDRRANLIYDFINKFWIRSIAVLYADSEFGIRAERAFSGRLSDAQRAQYVSLVYETPPVPDEQLDEILRHRPEAIGFFGERQEIDLVYGRLQEMNPAGTPYTPLMFTLLDARKIGGSVDDIYFVSVAQGSGGDRPAAEESDEVFELGHDTALLVLNEMQKQTSVVDGALAVDPRDPEWRETLRLRLVALLQNSVEQDGVRTEMSFTNFINKVRPRIFHLTGGVAEPEDVARTVGFTEKMYVKARIVAGSYGRWPIVALALIVGLAAFFSWIDMKSWFEGSKISPLNRFFVLFTVVRSLVVLALYLFLAETGAIRYDSVLMVVIISMTPSALARTTFFETPQGRAIGLERLYQRALLWVEEKLMHASHEALDARVNTVAYYNSQDGMRRALLDIYAHHQSPAQRAQLVHDLEEQLRNEKNYFERRRICARRLLKHKDWEQLRVEGLVPQRAVESDGMLLNPLDIVRLAARHCANNRQLVKDVRDLADAQLGQIQAQNPERAKELEDFLKWELGQAVAVEGELNVRLRFYYVLVAFDERELVDKGFLLQEDLDEYKRQLRERSENAKKTFIQRFKAWLGAGSG